MSTWEPVEWTPFLTPTRLSGEAESRAIGIELYVRRGERRTYTVSSLGEKYFHPIQQRILDIVANRYFYLVLRDSPHCSWEKVCQSLDSLDFLHYMVNRKSRGELVISLEYLRYMWLNKHGEGEKDLLRRKVYRISVHICM